MIKRILLPLVALLALVLSGGASAYIMELMLKVAPALAAVDACRGHTRKDFGSAEWVVAFGAIASLLLLVGGQRKLAYRIYDGAAVCMAVRMIQYAWQRQKPELEAVYQQYLELKERGVYAQPPIN